MPEDGVELDPMLYYGPWSNCGLVLASREKGGTVM